MLHVLKRNPLFEGLTPAELDHVIQCHQPRIVTFLEGQTVFSLGDTLQEVGVVITGQIALFKSDFSGNESIIQTMNIAESFGEAIAMTPNETTRVYAKATERTTVAFFRMAMFTTQAAHPCGYGLKIQLNLMRVLAQKLIQLHKKIDILAKRSIRERVLDYFLQLAHHGSECVIPFNRQALADYLNVDRSALAREMKKMQEEGLFTLQGRHVILKRSSS